jgi:hypothetical protein
LGVGHGKRTAGDSGHIVEVVLLERRHTAGAASVNIVAYTEWSLSVTTML